MKVGLLSLQVEPLQFVNSFKAKLKDDLNFGLVEGGDTMIYIPTGLPRAHKT